MDTDPKKTPDDEAPETAPLVPEIEDGDKVAENIREKGEPFDGNVA